METHLKFLPGQQSVFINQALKKSGLKPDKLAKLVNISPRNFRDWRREKISITKNATETIVKEFGVVLPVNMELLEKRWHDFVSHKASVGGKARYIKYGKLGTTEGRARGGKKALQILRERGVIPPSKVFNTPTYSEKLAELVGILLGDGGITDNQFQITLNSIADKEYIFFVFDLCTYLFKNQPKIFKKKDCNAKVVYYNGTNLIKILKNLGLKSGNKVKQQVGVPLWIKSNLKYSLACLRGLMDTDGGVFLHTYKVNGKTYKYKKVCFTNLSQPLLDFVYKTLKKVGFNPKIACEGKIVNKRVWLYNSHEVQQYLNVVGSSNYRLLKFKESKPIGSASVR